MADNPHLKEAQETLGKILTKFIGAPITQNMIHRIEDEVEDFRVSSMLRGIPLPKMKIVALPRSGYIELWPAEMEHVDLQVRLKNLIKKLSANNRPVDAEELAKAVRRAYPDYSPSTNALKLNLK